MRGALSPALLLALAAWGCGGMATTGTPPPAPPRADAPARPGRFDPVLMAELGDEEWAWVDSTLASLSLRAAAGQLVVMWMPGAYVSPTDPAFEARRRWVEEEGIGGIYLSIGAPHAFAAVSNELQARARVPLLVTSDLEDGGPGMRLNHSYALPGLLPQGGGTAFPPTMAVGATGDERRAYDYGRITAREARAVGVHLNFAPVLDVNSNPENPVIGTRSFGGDPEMVARMGAAYIRGLREGGALSTGKHFPGHGDTRTDSHFDLPVVDADTASLLARELVPFQAAVAAGVDAVMTAHVAIPGILGPDAPPATLAPEFLTGLLRDELGFTGLVITDALEMAAIADRYGAGEAAVLALRAGTDILLNPRDAGATLDAVEAAVADGRLTEARVRESARRVLALKARAGLHRDRFVDLEAVDDVVGSGPHLAVADSIARESLVLLRDPAGVLGHLPRGPLDLGDAATPPVRILSLTVAEERDLAAGRTLDALLRGAGHQVNSVRLGRDADDRDVAGLPGMAAGADLVLVGLYLPTRVGTDRDVLAPGLRAVLRQVARTRPTLAALLGSPYVVAAVPEQASVLLAWGGREVSQRAAAGAVLGEVPVTGILPVALPGLREALATAPRLDLSRDGSAAGSRAGAEPPGFSTAGEADPAAVGMSADTLARLDALLDSALADGAAPGAALAIGRRGRLVRLRGYGTLDRGDTTRVNPATLYDVASMTKVVGTTSAVMILVDRGLLSLDDPVVRHLPWWSAGDARKGAVTVRQLLTHTAGLPAFRRWFLEMEGRDAYRDAIASEALEAEPGTRTVYSDIGVMTLALLVEEITGTTLDAFLEQEVFEPLGMTDTGFNPDPAELGRIAPTEVDTLWRGGVHVRGVVHDENADAYGGVSGHAGLFSSARDLAVFAQFMLDRGVAGPCAPDPAPGHVCTGYGGSGPRRLVDDRTVETFTRRQDRRSSRALGWDTPSDQSSAGDFFSDRAFGHTGFTGTSIWIDPELDLFVVLLTNRVSPTRENTRHVPLRRAVHDLAARAIVDRPVPPRPGTPAAEGGR